MSNSNNPLIGTWQLTGWYNELEDGSKVYPLGLNPSGYISYSADGFVFVHMSAADRDLYAANDPFGGTPDENSAAVKSHISYAGPYEYRDGQVTHHVMASSFPNLVGTDQYRTVHIDAGRLELGAPSVVFQGKSISAKILWRRVG